MIATEKTRTAKPAVRATCYFMTLPWDDNGYRVLPAAAYMDHTEKMRELSNQFTPAVEALGHQFGQLVEEAKVRLGGLFRSEDYPAQSQ